MENYTFKKWAVPLKEPASFYENADTANTFKPYTDKLASILDRKNTAYGNSFDKSLDNLGLIAGVTRIYDKQNRLINLVKNPKIDDLGESLTDTLTDLAGYAILMVRYLDDRKNR